MSNLKNISDEDLKNELKRRKIVEKNKKLEEALEIENEIRKITPKPINTPDLTKLTQLCIEYVSDQIKNDYVSEDYPQWFEEVAIMTVMGKDVYKTLSKIIELKQKRAKILK